MKNKKVLILFVISVILIVGIGYFAIKFVKQKKNNEIQSEYIPQEEISDVQSRQTKILLYFENIETINLEAETQIIDANLLIENPYKKLIEFLIKGPQSTKLKKLIPDKTILNDVTVEKGCAIINFSTEFLNYENEENKLKIINSIVNTLTNLKEINSVSFLINGEKNENISEIYLKNK